MQNSVPTILFKYLIFIILKLNDSKPEDLSSETNERAFFNARKINENIKLDETLVIEIDQTLLNEKHTVCLGLILKKDSVHFKTKIG